LPVRAEPKSSGRIQRQQVVGRQVPGRRDGGATIVEVVVAMMVLAVMALAVEASVLSTMTLSVETQQRVTATHLASREIDLVREDLDAGSSAAEAVLAGGTTTNPHPLDGGTGTSALVVAGTAYTVSRTVSYRTVVDNGSVCSMSGSTLGSQLAVQVVVEVTWEGRRTAGPARIAESMLTTASEEETPYSYVAVQVTDGGSPPAAVADVRVQVVDTGTGLVEQTVTTDATGCALAAVRPGTGTSYEVVASRSGHVSPGWAAEPRTTVGLLTADGTVHGVTSTLAAAGTLEITVVGEDGRPVGDEEAATLVLSLSATSGLAAETVVQEHPTTATLLRDGLWPSTYSVWVGDLAPVPLGTVVVPAGGTVRVHVSLTGGIVAVDPDEQPEPDETPEPEPTETAEPSPEPDPTPEPTTAPAPSVAPSPQESTS
jgi:type II secretory pathway pseudopilin PulG